MATVHMWEKCSTKYFLAYLYDSASKKDRGTTKARTEWHSEFNSFSQLQRTNCMERWDKCAFATSEDDLEGRVCYGGLDLSSTTDITAFVLVFPPGDEDDKYIILPYFWIPEDNLDLRVRRDHVPYDVWERQGYLQTTEGNVVHYGYIEKFIERLGERYNIREIAFAMAKNAIGMAIACEEYGAKFFANGATPGGVLEHPGTIKDPQRVRDSWQAAFGGSSNANKVAVLEEGMKYTPISISPEQAQFRETRKFQINEIARIFRVPPHMVGDLEKSSFSNIEQQSLEFVKYTLDPWVIRWEQSIQRAQIAVNEIQVAAFLCWDAVEVFQFTDVVCGHPTVLATDGVAVHTALVIATEQTFQIELHEIRSLFISCQKRPHQGLLPPDDPGVEGVFHEL